MNEPMTRQEIEEIERRDHEGPLSGAPESQPQQDAPIPADLRARYNIISAYPPKSSIMLRAGFAAELIERIGRAEAALIVAEEGLRTSYNVQEYPGDGTSTQDDALRTVRAALAATKEP